MATNHYFPFPLPLFDETTAVWIKYGLRGTTPKNAVSESREEFYQRLQEVVADINTWHEVEGLCERLPKRLREVVMRSGDALKY